MKRFLVLAVVAVAALTMCAAMYAADKTPVVKQQPDKDQGAQIIPKKVSADTNYDGKPDRIEHYDEAGRIVKVEADGNDDGIMEETVVYSGGRPVKSMRDTNGDGKPDVWVDF